MRKHIENISRNPTDRSLLMLNVKQDQSGMASGN